MGLKTTPFDARAYIDTKRAGLRLLWDAAKTMHPVYIGRSAIIVWPLFRPTLALTAAFLAGIGAAELLS